MTSARIIEFFYRDRVGGRDDALKLGKHVSSGAGGMSLKEAFQRARAHAGRPAEVREARGELGDMLAAYVEHLKAAGKVSADDVRRAFLRAIPEFDPLRRKRASAVTAHDVTRVIAHRLRAGRTEAARLRSHLHAAFQFAMHADHNPEEQARDGVVRCGVTHNPVAPVARIAERPTNGNGQPPLEPRTLSWRELGCYWKALESEPEAVRATLRCALALGGQRLQQLIRATRADIDRRAGTIRLIDGKGRGQPRAHVLPLVPLAQTQIDALGDGEKVFPIDHWSLSDAIARASREVCQRLGCDKFDARAIRRSLETLLAEAGIDREVRAHLLSHGRTGGIQARYDFSELLPAKRAALLLLSKHLKRAIAARR